MKLSLIRIIIAALIVCFIITCCIPYGTFKYTLNALEDNMEHRRIQYETVVNDDSTALIIARAILKNLDIYWPEFDEFYSISYNEEANTWSACFMWGDEPGGDIIIVISKLNAEIIEIYQE